MKDGFLKSLVSNMGLKQGCPLYPTLFGLYINELEEVITKQRTREEVDGPSIGIYALPILLYADVVILVTHSYEGINTLLQLLGAFCDRSGLTVNVTKTKMMICSKGDRQTFTYNNRPIENVSEFKYLGIEIPSSYKWNRCMDRRLAAAKRMHYMMETICNHKDINNWKVRCIMFEAFVMQTMMYGVEMGEEAF